MKSDRKLLLFAVLFLLIQIIWLTAELKIIRIPWISELQNSNRRRVVGTIVSTQNSTRQRSESEIVWQDGIENESVHTYDALLTLKNSSMKIKLTNGSEMNLSENTLVYIEPMDENGKDQRIRIRFAKGSLRSKLSDLKNELNAQSWEMNAESGTEIQIKTLDSGMIELNVSKGEATATNQGEVVKVRSGEAVELGDHHLSQRRQISPTLHWSEERGKVRTYAHSFPSQAVLHWSGQGKALEIQRDGKIQETLPLNASQNQATVTLNEGSYEARILGEDGLTPWMELEMWRAPIIHLMAPLPRDRYGENEKFEYIWLKPKEIKTSQWQMSQKESFQSLERQQTTMLMDISNLSISPLIGVGHYHWRVLGYDSEGFEIPAPYSNPVYIVPDPLKAPRLNEPILRKPATPESKDSKKSEKRHESSLGLTFRQLALWQNLILTSAKADEMKITTLPIKPSSIKKFEPQKNILILSWDTVAGSENYVLEISKSPDFRSLMIEKKINSTTFQWKNAQFPNGVFYWRVASDSRERMGKFSPVAEVRLKDLENGIKVPGIDFTEKDIASADPASDEPAAPVAAPAPAKASAPAPVPAPAPEPITPANNTPLWDRTPEKFATLDLSYESTNWQDSAGTSYNLSGPTFKIFLNAEKVNQSGQMLGLLADLQYTNWKNVSTGSVANGTQVSELRSRILATIGSVHSRWIFSIGETSTGIATRTGLETATLSPTTMASVGNWYHLNTDEKWDALIGLNLSAASSLTEVAFIAHAHKKISEFKNRPIIVGPEFEISQFGGSQATGTRYMFGLCIGLTW